MRPGVRQGLAILLALLPGLPLWAANKINLDIDIGWRGHARLGAWTPLFIHVSATNPVGAMIDLYAPHDSSTALNIHQPITIGPASRTYTLYAPLLDSWNNPITLRIRDRATGDLLIERPLLDQGGNDYFSPNAALFKRSTNLFIAVSGRAPALGDLANGPTFPQLGFLSPE
jgi:hypothetical protein